GQGGGSGVLISADGYALSNFHVTSSVGDFMLCGLNDGNLYDAVIVGIDPTGDVALIKLLGRDDFPHAVLGDSDAVQVGDWVYVIGNPFLLATDFHPTVTYGIVSGVHRYQYPAGTFLEYADCLQVDASINPGNSGGPLFNANGELIGINGRASFEKRGRVNIGAGYAISINQIKHFMDHLRSGRIVDHATLGAVVSSRSDGAVVVSNIMEESEAFRRGLLEGDEIVSFAGRSIRSVNQFKNILGIYPKGWKLPLVYRRDEEKHEIYVRLRALHQEAELLSQGGNAPPQPMPEPDPEEKPEQEQDGQGPKKGEPRRPQIPIPAHGAAAAKVPEKYRHLLVKKSGFANYYFNQLEQTRILGWLDSLGNYANAEGTWNLTGRTDRDQAFDLTMAPQGVGLELGEQVFVQTLDDVQFNDEPPDTGGFLIALHQLKQMLVRHEEGFAELYYLGSEPLDGFGPQVDVLATTFEGLESFWYFRKSDGRFVGFNSSLDEQTDDCEVRFLSWENWQGRQFPKDFQVRTAARDFAVFHVEKFAIAPPIAPAD
ncbi:MAG: trypsin-like peptidase domain-containing protein, partial [Planctomycetota bacterium]|nr:trypsin-like peptidase domain-containing protein [Planctomycetota bacterium]